MVKEIAYNEYAREVTTQLANGGVFLTVKDPAQNRANIMTIGWGTIGLMWRKPIFMVMVRYSRHTYGLLAKAGEFTVSVPLQQDRTKELLICGRQSGRDTDKFQACGFTPVKGRAIDTPVIKECPLHFECRVVYQHAMEPGLLDPKLRAGCYQTPDYHVIYFGEILASYLTE
ncbi:MAG: flavin reductase family protein [Firmicutes bacterium]|nr:flavin reductase family protein [Bacillota bacterium]